MMITDAMLLLIVMIARVVNYGSSGGVHDDRGSVDDDQADDNYDDGGDD